MCGPPYDYCISAHIDRPDDFRGCGLMYRAGSILSDEYGVCQTAYYEDGSLHNNAGNYGITTPISLAYYPSDSQLAPDATIGMPSRDTGREDEWISEPGKSKTPTIKELIERPLIPAPMPIPTVPPAGETLPDETIPFSPGDAVVPPPDPFPGMSNELPITLEELKRLDPSVSDLQIISIEDTADTLLR